MCLRPISLRWALISPPVNAWAVMVGLVAGPGNPTLAVKLEPQIIGLRPIFDAASPPALKPLSIPACGRPGVAADRVILRAPIHSNPVQPSHQRRRTAGGKRISTGPWRLHWTPGNCGMPVSPREDRFRGVVIERRSSTESHPPLGPAVLFRVSTVHSADKAALDGA